MDDSDIDGLLDSAGWGIIALTDGDEPYSIPISFGYTGEDVYFAFIRDSPTNTKLDVIAAGATARLLVTDVKARFDWRSVAVTGPVEVVSKDTDEWQTLLDVLADNAWFSPGFERAAGVEELVGWRLPPEEIRGLEVRPDHA
jgi:hypothetical protein